MSSQEQDEQKEQGMRVDALPGPVFIVAEATDALVDVASRMRFNDVECAVVLEGSYVAGILTERDLVRAVADHADLALGRIDEYMTRHPVVVGPSAEALEAATMMARKGIAHLPVVDRSGFKGVVSLRAILPDLLSTKHSP